MADQREDQAPENIQVPDIKRTQKPVKAKKTLSRDEKLAQALRANLRRRKQAARDKKD